MRAEAGAGWIALRPADGSLAVTGWQVLPAGDGPGSVVLLRCPSAAGHRYLDRGSAAPAFAASDAQADGAGSAAVQLHSMHADGVGVTVVLDVTDAAGRAAVNALPAAAHVVLTCGELPSWVAGELVLATGSALLGVSPDVAESMGMARLYAAVLACEPAGT